MLVVAALAFSGSAAVAAASDFEHPASNDPFQNFNFSTGTTPNAMNPQRFDTPNDPNYDQAEKDSAHHDPKATTIYDEPFGLFGWPSEYSSTSATYKDPSDTGRFGKSQISGFNASGAWKLSRGVGRSAIAILDTGIRWDDGSLRDQIHLNTRELPLPQQANGQTNPHAGLGGFDLNGNGVVDVDDFKDDHRVPHTTAGAGGQITAEDLIKTFGHCQITNHVLGACPAGGKFDNDHNGYPNDIAGWNFFDDDNDPLDRSSYFAAHNHGTGRAQGAAERGNDGQGSIGVCPHCSIIPIRIWDTFVSDANNFALGILYGTDNGAKVIEGSNGSLYHSAFAEQASNYAYSHGVVQTFSGDDLNTGDHNYPANYGHAMLIQGTDPDTMGLGTDCSGASSICSLAPFGSNLPPETYFRGANTTQYGGKSSVSLEGPTGSENTGKASGAAGLVISAAMQHGITLSADETREILEQTAEDITAANTVGVGTPDPAQPGWDSHFGWGRVDLGKAVSVAASAAKVPDPAAIDAPDWYAPLTGSSLKITGRADAPRNGHQLHYKLEWGPGLAPTTWHTVTDTNATGPVTSFGTINLNDVRAAMASFSVPPDPGGPVFSPTSRNPYKDQFAVRLTVTDPTGTTRVAGVDRRVFTAVPDGQSLRPGYPKRLGTGGEAQPRYADINGDGVEELILPTEDGLVHAYEPNGTELPGWPVKTQVQFTAVKHTGAPGVASMLKAGAPPREPPRGAAVADIDGDGIPEVITAAGIHIYAWEPDGSVRKGFPVSSNMRFCGPSLERQQDRHPKCGFVASPTIARHLEGPKGPSDIVEPSLDGHLYAFRPNGKPVPHYPVLLQDPHPPKNAPVLAESINGPAIGDLNHDGYDDVVAASNETYGTTSSSGDVSFTNFASNATGASTRVYAINGKNGSILSGWPIKINGLIEDTLPFVGPGNDPALLDINGSPEVVASATSGSLATYKPNGAIDQNMHQETDGPSSNATDRSPGINLFEGAAIGKVAGSGTPDVVKYELSTSDAANLLLVGQNFPYNHLIGAWDSSNGSPLPAWPTITDDFQFLSSSLVAKVDSSASDNQVVAGTGLGLLHAYAGSSGQDVSGFPKVTGGWLFAPAALSTDGRIADLTREGYLFEWAHRPLAACQSEWPTFRHDPQDTGNYNRDGTAPAAPKAMTLRPLGHGRYHLSFISPGDDGFCGKATSYRVKVDGAGRDIGLGAPVSGGSTVSKDVTLPSGAADLTVQAVDEAGNVGEPADVFLTRGKAPCRSPRTTIDKSTLSSTHKRIVLTGLSVETDCKTGKRVSGHIKSMRLTVARVSKGKCRFMNGGGRLGHSGRCSKPHYLRVRITSRTDKLGIAHWVFRHKVRLQSGRYVMAIRAGDSQKHRETLSRSANTISFRLF